MAKFGALSIMTDAKFAPGVITKFFAPAGGGTSITVNNDSVGNPNLIYVTNSTGSFTIVRSSDGSTIFAGTGYVRNVAIDYFPGLTETYTRTGSALITGAVVRLR